MTDRIKQFRVKIFGTQASMAEVLQLKTNAIGAYESGLSFLKPEKIAFLIDNYNLNANWLLSGKGNMLLNDIENSNIQEIQKENEKLKIENALLKELINNQNNR